MVTSASYVDLVPQDNHFPVDLPIWNVTLLFKWYFWNFQYTESLHVTV